MHSPVALPSLTSCDLPVVPTAAARPECESDDPHDERDDGNPPECVYRGPEPEEQRDDQQAYEQRRHQDRPPATSCRQPLTSIVTLWRLAAARILRHARSRSASVTPSTWSNRAM